ncbi:MAG TPA: PRC-barrel domain-containing protein [Ktedonobacteraceae bacterium]|jgi:uncharacterized protein YrrD|nr:PRC-barrel domain-containing protein [Ktedonobacteraceae bacterium]
MNGNSSIRDWFELRGLPVTIPSEGKRAGIVEDFYYEPETNSIYALRVNVGVWGYKALTSNAIQSIQRDAITVANDQMLILESHGGQLNEFPLSERLFNSEVKSESGQSLGKIQNILVATDPPVALHVAAFRLTSGKTFAAEEVTDFNGHEMFVLDKAAARLR